MTTTINASNSGGGGLVQTADASGILALQTAGVTAATVDASQNVGIGTSSPGARLDIRSAALGTALQLSDDTNYGVNFIGVSGGLKLAMNGSQTFAIFQSTNERLTIDSSGNVGIGTTSSSAKLEIKAASASQRQLQLTHFNSTDGWYFTADDTGGVLKTSRAGSSGLNGEAMRIDSNGNVLVGTTSQLSGEKLGVLSSAANQMVYFRNSNASPGGIFINYSASAPNNTGSEFLFCNDTAQTRMTVRSNGGIANYSGNNVNLSDRREKTNFAPAKSYLDVICAIPVQTFNYADQNMEEDPGLTLGVAAQDVQAVAPELVSESDWSSERDGSKMRLSIYQTDLQYALMKCIQEQQALITSLTARIAALEGTPA